MNTVPVRQLNNAWQLYNTGLCGGEKWQKLAISYFCSSLHFTMQEAFVIASSFLSHIVLLHFSIHIKLIYTIKL